MKFLVYTRKDKLDYFGKLNEKEAALIGGLKPELIPGSSENGMLWKKVDEFYVLITHRIIADREVDERVIPLVIVQIMDEKEAHAYLADPQLILQRAAYLQHLERDEALALVGREDASLAEFPLDPGKVSSRQAHNMITACFEALNETFSVFYSATPDTLICALKFMPLCMRKEVSFAYPFSGTGAGLTLINLVDDEILGRMREQGHSGFPMHRLIQDPAADVWSAKSRERKRKLFELINDDEEQNILVMPMQLEDFLKFLDQKSRANMVTKSNDSPAKKRFGIIKKAKADDGQATQKKTGRHPLMIAIMLLCILVMLIVVFLKLLGLIPGMPGLEMALHMDAGSLIMCTCIMIFGMCLGYAMGKIGNRR